MDEKDLIKVDTTSITNVKQHSMQSLEDQKLYLISSMKLAHKKQ